MVRNSIAENYLKHYHVITYPPTERMDFAIVPNGIKVSVAISVPLSVL